MTGDDRSAFVVRLLRLVWGPGGREVVDSTDDAEPRPTDVPGGEVGSAERVDRLETIIELAPVGIGIVDFEGRTGMANEVLRRLAGLFP